MPKLPYLRLSTAYIYIPRSAGMVVGTGQEENADNNGAAALVLGDKVWQLFLQKWSLSSSKSPEFF